MTMKENWGNVLKNREMTNAKEEFLTHIHQVNSPVEAVQMAFRLDDDEKTFLLKPNYTPEEYDAFLASIDVEYYAGYGSQKLFGTIWFTDGTWSSRGEYDGSEWWQHHQRPALPQ